MSSTEIVAYLVKSIAPYISNTKKRKSVRFSKKYILKNDTPFNGGELEMNTKVFCCSTQIIFELRRSKKGKLELIPVRRLKRDTVVMAKKGENKNVFYLAGQGIVEKNDKETNKFLTLRNRISKNKEIDQLQPKHESDNTLLIPSKSKESVYTSFKPIIKSNSQSQPIDNFKKMITQSIIQINPSILMKNKIIDCLDKLSILENNRKQELASAKEDEKKQQDIYKKMIKKFEEEEQKRQLLFLKKLDDVGMVENNRKMQSNKKLTELDNEHLKKINDQRGEILKLISEMENNEKKKMKELDMKLEKLN